MINWIKEKILSKRFFVIVIIIIVLCIGAYALYYFGLPKWIVKLGAPKPLSEKEIQKILPTLTRTYPDIVKGNWEPAAFYMSKMIKEDSDELRALGVNTVSVTPEYEFDEDGTYFLYNEELARSNIVLAKQKGFAVWLCPNFVGGELISLEEKGVDISLEEYLALSDEVALEWAKVAEEFNVEYFCPHNELDFMVSMNFEEDRDKRARILADWHKQILPKIREVYSGKVIVKIAWIDESIVETASDYTGYDYVGTDISHGNNNLEQYREMVKQGFENASRLAVDSNSKWMIVEAWFAFGTERFNTNFYGESLDELQDDYVEIATEEYLKIKENKPVGYVFHSWIMPESRIKGRDAEEAMKEFFNKL